MFVFRRPGTEDPTWWQILLALYFELSIVLQVNSLEQNLECQDKDLQVFQESQHHKREPTEPRVKLNC